MIENESKGLAAVDAGGHVMWSLDRATVEAAFHAPAQDDYTARTVGPNLLVVHQRQDFQYDGRLVLFDRSGRIVGTGTYTASAIANVYGDPTGSQWAWSVDDSSLSDQSAHHGRIVVAGLVAAAHTVYRWVAPVGATEIVAGWTDMGIVMERVSFGGCGVGFHPDTASFLIDPVAGTLGDLFDGQAYADARDGVRVAFATPSSSVIDVDGTAFDEPHTVANLAVVSPDGARVAVQRFSMGGCAGDMQDTLSTEVIDVSTGAHTDLAGCGIDGWFDATHFVCHAWSATSLRLEGIDGSAGAMLGSGQLIGTLPSA